MGVFILAFLCIYLYIFVNQMINPVKEQFTKNEAHKTYLELHSTTVLQHSPLLEKLK